MAQTTQTLNAMQDVLQIPYVLKTVGQALKPPRHFCFRDVSFHLPRQYRGTKHELVEKIVHTWVQTGLVVQVSETNDNGKSGPGFIYSWAKKENMPKTPEAKKLLQIMGLSAQDFEDDDAQDTPFEVAQD